MRRSMPSIPASRIASTWVNGVLAWDGERLVGAANGKRLVFSR